MTTPVADRPAPAVPARLSVLGKTALVAEILLAYGRARATLARRGLKPTLARLRDSRRRDRRLDVAADEYLEGLRLGRAVVRVLRPLPVESRCLMRSLVLTRLLSRRGIGSTLVIGVRPGSDFGAHAWVESGDRPLLPPGHDEFQRLVDL
jgi:hypothetical protein